MSETYNPEPLTEKQRDELRSFDYSCTDPKAIVRHIELGVYFMWSGKYDLYCRTGRRTPEDMIEDDRKWVREHYDKAIEGNSPHGTCFDRYAKLPVPAAINWDLYGAEKFVPLQKYNDLCM